MTKDYCLDLKADSDLTEQINMFSFFGELFTIYIHDDMLLSNVYEWHHFGLLIDVYMAPHFLESRQTGHAQRRWLINLPEPSLPAKKGWAVKNIDSPAWCVVNC